MATRGSTHQTTYTYDVRPGIGSLRGAIANGAGAKAFVLLVRFYDEHDRLIPGPYLRFSYSRLGAYRYLPGGSPTTPSEFDIPLFMPDGARRLDALFCGWETDSAIAFARPPQPAGQIRPRLPRPLIPAPAPRQMPASKQVPAAPPKPTLICDGLFEKGRLYEIDVTVAPGEGDGEKAHLLVVECLDRAGQVVSKRLPGFSFSETAGCYVYISFAAPGELFQKVLKLAPPEGATAYRVLLKRWQGKGTPRVLSVEQRALLDHPSQVESVSHQIEEAIQAIGGKLDRLVMITATTRAIESENRLNRPQVLAQEFARQDFLVFYVYYRFAKSDPLPERRFNGIVQIPNDIFQILAPRIARAQAAGPRIAIFSIPDDNSVRQLGVFQRYRWRTVYEVRDDWEEFAAADVGKWYNPLWERFLTTTCEQTICVSPPLASKMLAFGCPKDRVSLSHNATTSRFIEAAEPFRRRRTSSIPLAGERPVLGYFGHLTEAWFDWSLIAQAATLRPNWLFEFIGFGAPKELVLPQNVTIKDAVPQLELPTLSRTWDIGMIPFRPSPLSRAVDPIKVYDYQALGLPTLSVPMSLIHLLDNVQIYQGLNDFLAKADALVSRLRLGPLDWNARPSEHTWAARAGRIVDLFSPDERDATCMAGPAWHRPLTSRSDSL